MGVPFAPEDKREWEKIIGDADKKRDIVR